MKHRFPVSFFLAFTLHLLLILPLWIAFPQTQQILVPAPKRFHVLFGEDLVSEESLPSAEPATAPAQATALPTPTDSIRTGAPSPQSPTEIPRSSESEPYTPNDRESLPRSVLHHYGEEFFDLSPGEQHYIIDNLQRIRKINEIVGTRLLRERPDAEVDPDDSNVVEFRLHPDGTISDFHLQKNRVGALLDELTLQTITLAHTRYPKPDQTTLIKIRVYIVIR